MLLTRPLPWIVEQIDPSVIRDRPLDGNRVLLMLDYEYIPTGFDSGQLTAGLAVSNG